ncbi:MAG: hypothetical protein ACRDKU_01445 [Gaiellaceae bacterium]
MLAVSALALAGCGAAPSPEQPAAEADTARIIVSYDEYADVEGVFDLRSGSGVIDGPGPEAILTLDAAYQAMEEQLASAGEKRWLKSPRDMFDPLLVSPVADGPEELLAFLASADRGEPVGEGEVRGEPVTHYAATVRMDEFLATLTPVERADLNDYYAEWEGTVFQLAVDSQGRFRRAEFAFWDFEEIVIEIFDYGVEVDAKAPDPSTVLSWAEYEELLRAECERLKKKGLEKTKPHCFSCGASEGEGEA